MQHDSNVVHVPYALTRAEEDALLARYGAWDVVHDEAALQQYTAAAPSQFVSDYGDTDVFLTHAADDSDDDEDRSTREHTPAGCKDDDSDNDDDDGVDEATRRALLSTLPLESLLVQQSTMLGADTPPSLLACVGNVLAQRRSASQAKGTAAAAGATTVCEGDVNGTDDSDKDGTTTADDNVQHSADDEDERLVRRAEALLAKADCHADNVCGNNNGSSDDDDGGGGDDDECAPEKTSERAVAAHNLVDDSDDSDESDDTTSLLCEARIHIARWAPLQERLAAVMAAAAEEDEEDDDEDVGEEDEDAHDDVQATRARDMHVDVDATATRSLATPRTHEHVSDDNTTLTATATAHEQQQQQQPLLLPVLFAFESTPTRAEEALLHAFDEAARRCSDVCTQRAHAHVTSNSSSNNNSNNAGDDDDDKHDEQQLLLHRLQRQAEARTRATAAALRALYADPCADVSVTDDTAAGDAATSSAPPLPLVDEVAVQMRDARVQARAERRYTRVHGALTRRRREVRQLWHRRADVGLAPLRTAVECVDTLLPPPAQEMRLRQQRTAAEAKASEQADGDGVVVSSSHVPAIAPSSSSSSQPPPQQQQHSPSSPSSLPAHGDDFCAGTHNNNNNNYDGDAPTQRIVRRALRERFRLCMERREAGALRREDAYAVSCARAREAQSRLLQTRLREAAAACARDGDAAYAVLCVCEAKERAALMRAANESAQRAWCSAVRGVCEAHACGVTALTADEAAARVRLHDSERAARVPALRRAYSRYAAAQRRRVRATCAQATACASPVSSSSLPLPLHDEAADKDADRRGALLRLRALVDEQRQHAAWLRHGGGARRWLRAALDAANDERERTRHADRTTTTRAASTRDNVNDDGEQRLVDAVFAHIYKDDDDNNKTTATTARLDTARLWQHPLLQLLRRAVHASRDGDGEVCSSSALRRVLPLYARVLSFALDGLDVVGDEGDGGATHTRARAVTALTHEIDLGGNALTSLHTGALHRAFPALRRLRVNDNAIAHIHCDDGGSGSSSSSLSLLASSSPLLTRPRSVAAARVNARAERVHIADVDVSSNRLCRLDDVAAWLSHSLRQLRAGHNRITSATPLALCRRLAVVDVSRNALRRLDDAVATLPLLRELNVCNNQLTRLYNSGSDDDNNNDDNDRHNKRRSSSSSSTAMACALPPLLQTLYASDNPLTTLQLCAPPPPSSSSPSSLLQPRLFVLTQLFANHAQLHELHADAMRCMPLLTVLHLEGNALCDVRALRCCTRLCVLNVSHNRLATRASLCAALATCRTLVELRLRGNPLLLQSSSTASLLRRLTRTLPCLREVDGEAVVQRHSNGHASAAATAAAVMCKARLWRSVCAPSLLPSRVYAAAAAAVAHDMCLHDVRTRLDVHAIALSRDVRVAEAAAATTTAITATTTSSTQHEDDDSNKHVVRRGEGAVLLASAAALHRSRVWSDGEAALLRVAADAVDTIVRYNSSDSNSIEHMYCNAHVCNDVYAQRARAHAQRAARQRIAAWLRGCVLRRRARRVLCALRAAADAARLARYTAAARRIQPVWRGALLRARLRRLLYNTKATTSGNDDEDDDEAAFVKVSDADLFGDGDAALIGVTGHSGNGADVDSDGLRPLLRRVMATRAALPSFAVDMTSSTTTNNNSSNNNDNSNKCSSHTAHDALTPSAQTTSDGAHNDHDVSSGSNDGDEDNESRSSGGGGGGAGAGVDEAWRALHGAALAARLAKQKRRMARVHTQHVREAFASDPLRAKKLMTLADTSRHNKNNNNNNNNSNSSKKQQHK